MKHLLATVQIRYGGLSKFCELMTHLVPVLEARGWRLQSAHVVSIGRLFKIYDLWQIPDANSFGSVLAAASADPEFARWAARLGECVESEQVELLDDLPYSP
jgi:hypothetical protein